ncbi:MAG: hypothetical protein AAB914_04825 [Patescibacteria group bacterium]
MTKTKKIILIVIVSIAIVVAGIYLYNKKMHKDNNTPTNGTTTSDGINYAPPTKQEFDESQNRKKQAIDQVQNNSSNTAQNIVVSLSAANQDVPGGPLVIRSIVSGVESGKCTVTLGNSSKTYASDIINLGNYYGCAGVDIPASELSQGKTTLTLSVVSGAKTGKISQEVEIKK